MIKNMNSYICQSTEAKKIVVEIYEILPVTSSRSAAFAVTDSWKAEKWKEKRVLAI